ncbi:MAG: proton-conducting transporter membrane subunit [Actinomycetota bacterium]
MIATLPLLIPLAGAALVVALREHPRARDAAAVAAAVTTAVVVALMIPGAMDGERPEVTLAPFLPDAPILLRVDPLGLLLLLTATLLWPLTAIYAGAYFPTDAATRGRFHAFVALTLASTAGVAFAGNLVTLYLFYEMMTFATYPLVVLSRGEEAMAGGRRYLTYQLGTGIALFLPAVILTYVETGSFEFTPGGLFGPGDTGILPVAIFVLFLFGIAKAALVPVHLWLPAAMAAPVPVSALLHAVAVVNVGVFALFRVLLEVFGPASVVALRLDLVTIIVASTTVLVASLIALQLDKLKPILAYSTIGQLSYMLLGVALVNDAGMTGGMFHLVGHSVSKITLFFAVGAIAATTGATSWRELTGLAQRMPHLVIILGIGAASIVGLPPTAGFVTKYLLFVGAVEARAWLPVVVLAASTVLAATYYLRLVRTPLTAGDGAGGSSRPIPPAMLIPMGITAAVTVLLGIVPGPLLTLVRAAVP